MSYVLVILIDHRREVVYFNVAAHPTANWTGQQIIEALLAHSFVARDG